MSVVFNPLSGNFETKEPGPQGPAGTVSAAGDGSQGTPSISFASATDTGLYKYAPGSIAVSTSGTGKLFIDSNGRVGIGASTPGNTLHLKGTSGVGTRVQNTTNNLDLYQTFEGTEFRNNISGTGVFTWYTGGGEKFRIANNGNIGVNTANPGDLVEIKTGLDRSLLIRGNRTSSPVDLFAGNPASGYGLRDMSFSANTLRFGTGANSGTTATERLVIDSSGTATFAAGVTGDYFATNTTAGSFNFFRNQGGSSALNTVWGDSGGAQRIKFFNNGTSEFAGQAVVGSNTAGASKVRIDPTGYVNIQSTASAGEALRIYDPSSTQKITLKADGSGEFAGGNVVLKSGSGYSSVEIKNNTQRFTLGTDGATNNLRLYNNTSTTTFSSWQTNGDFYHGGGAANGTDISSPNLRLNADGSATFAGNVTAGDAGRTSTYAVIQPDGYVASAPASDSGTAFAVYSFNQSATTIQLQGSGAATFADGVTADYFSANTTAGSFSFFRNQGGSSALNTVWGDASGAQKIKFFNNGSASFTGFVTEPPVTNYYTSATPTTGDTNSTGSWATNASIAPDGTKTASKFTASSIPASSRFSQISSSVNLNSTAYTLSFYAKSESGSNQTISVDLGDSTVTSITVTTSWQRFVLTSLVPTSGRFIDFGGIDGNWSLWGVQIQTENAATSYVEPSGGVATTSAARATVGTRFSDYSDFFVAGDAEIDGNLSVNDALTKLVRNNNIPLNVKRLSSDGKLVTFLQENTEEGDISVSGSTVSLNGAHLTRWSQLAGGAERTEILRGSVLSNLDEMCEWGEEDNEQLNRMKVSDVEGDRNVAGVFQSWDDDDDTYTNDFYCAMTGDFVIRIAQGTTVARGDLLMSAGDGTAKPQDDDIVRSKTIAKVTSTVVSETYSDGSYCVPCVLMAC